MIKNPWPCKYRPIDDYFSSRNLNRICCPYMKRFNLICFGNRKKDCPSCYFKQQNLRSSEVVHVCDRCGFPETGASDRLTYITITNRDGGILANAELCEACAKMLGEWLQNKDFFDNFYDDTPDP